MVRLIAGLLLSAALAACARGNAPAEPADSITPAPAENGLTPAQQSEWNAIESLEAQAKAIAKIDGCTASGDCKTAAIGSRACGGPRYYIPYCAKSTDVSALTKKLDEVAKAEQAYNTKYQLASTCEMRMPPPVELSGGSCVAR